MELLCWSASVRETNGDGSRSRSAGNSRRSGEKSAVRDQSDAQLQGLTELRDPMGGYAPEVD